MTFAQKRKRVARRMLRNIEWKLRKMYYHSYHFDQSEQELLYSRTWWEAQLDYNENVLTGFWRPGKVITLQIQ